MDRERERERFPYAVMGDRRKRRTGEQYPTSDSANDQIVIQRREQDPDTLYSTVEKIVLHRWNKMTTPLHLLAYALSPRYYSSEILDILGRVPPYRDPEVAAGYKRALSKLFSDPDVASNVRREFVDFVSGKFAEPDAINDQSRLDAIGWWYLHGERYMYLQPLAIKILSQFRPKRIAAVPPFDAKRAESSRQHVRALNSQFSRWVQNQLKDHPDELWQDGVQDYIKHATEILVQFSDVVEWLKANANLSQQNVPVSMSNGVSPSIEKQIVKGDSKSELPVQVEDSKKPGIGLPSGSWSFGLTPNNQDTSTTGSWSFGLASANQNSPVTGNLFQPTVPVIEAGGASNNLEEDGEDVERPPSPSVKRAEEPGTAVVHEVKCKLYAKPENGAEKGWKDMGMGQLYIKCKEDARVGTKDAKATIVIRNDVGKVVLNALLYPNMKLNVQKNTITTILYTADGELKNDEAGREKKEVGKARLYLLKLKSEDEAMKLEGAINKNVPAAE